LGVLGSAADFVTLASESERVPGMSQPNRAADSPMATMQQAGLDEELRQAEADFASGDFFDLTIEELDRCIAAGEWPE
jgi:hypothetical protein